MWNVPPRRILVATDFGEASTQAARIAGELARAFNARVTAVHAETFDAPPYFTAEQIAAIEHQRRNARRDAAQYLARTVGHLAGVPVEPVIAEGPVAEAVLGAAAGHDLIVMGTHGRRGPARWWAGSVAERVARHADVPVLVVRAETASAAALFATLAIPGAEGHAAENLEAYADQLAAPFTGAVAVDDQTLAVVAQRGTHATFAAEQALKTCRIPVLVVPVTEGGAAGS